MYLESASIPGFFITMNSDTFNLATLGTTTQELTNQAIYIEKPKLVDNNYIGDDVQTALHAVLKKLGYEVEFENKYEN